jgi:hypothetical protein
MNKDKTILKLPERLKLVIDINKLHIVDHWEGDICTRDKSQDTFNLHQCRK